jgi:hypothetical protein
MRRYIFDLRERGVLEPDQYGTEFATIDAVQKEAARVLADMARDNNLSKGHDAIRDLSVEVRDVDGPVMLANISFQMLRQGP